MSRKSRTDRVVCPHCARAIPNACELGAALDTASIWECPACRKWFVRWKGAVVSGKTCRRGSAETIADWFVHRGEPPPPDVMARMF